MYVANFLLNLYFFPLQILHLLCPTSTFKAIFRGFVWNVYKFRRTCSVKCFFVIEVYLFLFWCCALVLYCALFRLLCQIARIVKWFWFVYISCFIWKTNEFGIQWNLTDLKYSRNIQWDCKKVPWIFRKIIMLLYFYSISMEQFLGYFENILSEYLVELSISELMHTVWTMNSNWKHKWTLPK